MQLKTILNHVEKQKGFVYSEAHFNDGQSEILVTLNPHARSRPLCSVCGQKRPGYDIRSVRRFQFVPLWGKETASIFGTSWDTVYAGDAIED